MLTPRRDSFNVTRHTQVGEDEDEDEEGREEGGVCSSQMVTEASSEAAASRVPYSGWAQERRERADRLALRIFAEGSHWSFGCCGV